MNLVWTRRALADLHRIADHIAADNPAAASKLVDAFRDKATNLERFPLIGRAGGYGDTRERVVHKNDRLTYRLRGDEVQVLQVWHVARHRP